MTPLTTGDLVLCGGTVRGASFADKVDAAAAAGFQGLSLYWSDYQHAGLDGWTDAGMRRLLDDHGLAVAELDGHMGWLDSSEPGVPSPSRFLDAAVALGARSVTALEITGRPVALEAGASAFAALCDQAAEAGLLVHLEYFPWSGIADIATAYALARQAGRPNGGVMVDVWHHVRGPDAGALNLNGVPGAAVLAVQVGDVLATPGASVAHEGMHERLLPGQGAGNVGAILLALRHLGCTAPMEVEVYSDRLAALPPRQAARLAGDALRAVLAEAGVS
jgi:sugar phosphate isomerase/epimerase